MRQKVRLTVMIWLLSLIASGSFGVVLASLEDTSSVTTILPATFKAKSNPPAAAPGKAIKIIYHWQAAPMKADCAVFVHFINEAGATVFQDDHHPPTPTSRWSGPISYARTVNIPPSAGEGTYRIVAGLYSAGPNGHGWENHALLAGKGILSQSEHQYEIATLKIDRTAPVVLDSDGPVTLNLKGYRLTFDEKFNDLSVSAWGPGTCWIAHKPDHLDFGDARFTDPSANFPFTIRDGILRIEAKKDADGWKSGILSSCDAKGNGFAQLYGYFEMRAKFPKGPGTWPAFWMLSRDHLLNPKVPDVEYDIVEQYGQWPDIIHTVLHLWIPGNHVGIGEQHRVADTTADFHRYGLLWDATQIVWYFDGVELMRQPTPPEAHRPMYLLLDLALGAGWPIDHTPNPSLMLVDYLRAYATDDSARAGNQPTPHTDPIPDHRK